MNIEFKSIVIDNFMSIGHAELSFVDNGFVVVSGINNAQDTVSNGAGKSSVFEALYWVLTGTTIRGTRDIVNRYAEGGTSVVLNFCVSGDSFCVQRTREHPVLKNSLHIYKDGKDLSGKGLRESDKKLTELLPSLTEEFLSSVVILGQGLPNRFSSNSPTGRKEILENLTNQDLIVSEICQKIQLYFSTLNDNAL